ncbi:hypothetical protein [Deinococcus sp. RM]|uniref:hypothetical protein n=1 Tax=Deinococcus sp. RM TaxID=2316359 RepID=UPI0011C22129|nr:hypothetical protein [Deinococcus sp. RM]
MEVFRGFPGEGFIEGEFKAVTDFLSILPNKSVPVPPDGPLRELNELIDRVVVASGWWEKHQALHYVMTGYPPTPLIHRSVHKTVPPFYYRLPSRAGGSGTLQMPIFDIRVEVPISHEEWRQLLPKVATANGRRPKRLTVTHVALLQLKAQTPESSWAYRLALWEEWRRNYPEAGLKEFGSERLIRKQWALAGQYVVAWMSASDPKPRSPVR